MTTVTLHQTIERELIIDVTALRLRYPDQAADFPNDDKGFVMDAHDGGVFLGDDWNEEIDEWIEE